MWIVGENVSWGFNYDLADMIGVNNDKLVFHMRDSNCKYVLQFKNNALAKAYWIRMANAKEEGARKFVVEKDALEGRESPLK